MTSLHTLESKALRHWREFLPSMVARLAEEGQLETRVRHAALTAQQEIRELVHNSGYQEHEAEEVVLPKLILLKPEVDAGPAWERDELDEKERQYQAMMAEPADEDE